MRGRRTGPTWTDGSGAQPRRIGRAGNDGNGAGRPGRSHQPKGLGLVSRASRPHRAGRSPTYHTSPWHGTKTETITPRKNLAFSPTHSRPLYSSSILLSRVSSEEWCEALLTAVATHIVGNRPDRFEPRLRKRRPKPYKHLREPRRNYKS
jgi:hypothetical protein